MEKYRRFTKKTNNLGNIIYLGDGISIDQDMNNNNLTYAYGEALDYFAELEDKIKNGTFIELPCIRKINNPLGVYEAVYINERDLMQECIINTEKEGWWLIEKYGCPKHSEIAEAKLKELQND